MSLVSGYPDPLYSQHFTSHIQPGKESELLNAPLSESNVLLKIADAFKHQDIEGLQSYCFFIREHTKISIHVMNASSVSLGIYCSYPNKIIPEEILIKYLDDLTKLFTENELKIIIDIRNYDEELMIHLTNYGKFVHQLSINEFEEINDNQFATILGFCPNLNNIWISSPTLTNSTLGHIQRLEKLCHLELYSCPNVRQLPNLMGFKNLNRVIITKCPILQFPDVAGHTTLKNVEISCSDQLESYPDFTECAKLRNVSFWKCSNLKGKPIFKECANLYSVEIDNCPLNEQVDLNDCIRLKSCTFGRNVGVPPLISECAMLEMASFKGSRIKEAVFFGRHPHLMGIDFANCQDLSEEERIASFKNFTRYNPESALRLLNKFGILNLTPLEEFIFESTLSKYDFNNLDKDLESIGQRATQELRKNFLSYTLYNKPETALKYYLFFGIRDRNYIEDLFRETDVVKEIVNDPSFRIHDPKNLILYCSYLQMVKDNDFPKRIPNADAFLPLYREIELNSENIRRLNRLFHQALEPTDLWRKLIINNDNKMVASLSINGDFDNLESNPQLLYRALDISAEIGDITLAKKILSSATFLNREIHQSVAIAKSRALLRACKNRDPVMSLFLIKHGASAKYVGGTHDHQTPLSEARINANEMAYCLSHLEKADAGFTDEVMATLILAHKFAIGGAREIITSSNPKKTKAAKMRIHRLGFRPRYVVRDYVRMSRPFYDRLKPEITEKQGELFNRLSPEARKLIQALAASARKKLIDSLDIAHDAVKTCLDYEGVDLDANDGLLKNRLLRRLNEGFPLVLFGVTRTKSVFNNSLHAWGFVVFKIPASDQYIIYRCNRGYGADFFYGGVAVVMGEREMFKIVSDFQSFTRWKTETKEQSEQFLNDINARFTNDTGKFFLEEKQQHNGNCCYTSLQAIELSLLHGLFSPIVGHESALLLAKEIKSLRSVDGRIASLGEYLQWHSSSAHSTYPPDMELIDEIMKKTLVKRKMKYKPIIDMIEKYKSLLLDEILDVNDNLETRMNKN